MVTVSTENPKPLELYGLSTDSKPTTIGALVGNDSTDKLPNGSVFFEMDDKKVYLFDAENGTWEEF